MNGTFQVTANGIPAPSFTTTGPLPPSVTLSLQGLLSGTPDISTGGNAYPFTIQATNGVAPDASQLFTLRINRPPQAGANVLGASKNTATVMSTAKLLLTASDPDSDPLVVSAVAPASAQGGSVTLNGSVLTYTPANNYLGSDVITYTISDGRGGTVQGSVQVTVQESNAPSLNIVSLTIGSGGVTIVSQGLRGASYRVQSTDALTTPFTDLSGDLTADTNGRFVYLDARQPGQLPPSRYYRIVEAP